MQLVTLFALVAFACADKIPDFVVPGSCPNIDRNSLYESQRPNHSKFGGLWHMYARTSNSYDLLEKCHRMDFDFDGQQFNFKATGVAYDGNLMRRNGLVYPNPFGEPHLTIDVDDSFAAPLVILDTDYNNYACLHSCIDYNFGYKSEFSLIYVRSPNTDDRYAQRCLSVFKEIGVEASQFQVTTQGSSCPYEAQKSL
ncbi:crustacyanin-C1 subunit-like [Oratosquilla oratoria]|uniref:crustacyanin-C1 subunit-like n=1 Tax=Oratosquilla oratoria TaxID=337810 RepID=UPI003F759850